MSNIQRDLVESPDVCLAHKSGLLPMSSHTFSKTEAFFLIKMVQTTEDKKQKPVKHIVKLSLLNEITFL